MQPSWLACLAGPHGPALSWSCIFHDPALVGDCPSCARTALAHAAGCTQLWLHSNTRSPLLLVSCRVSQHEAGRLIWYQARCITVQLQLIWAGWPGICQQETHCCATRRPLQELFWHKRGNPPQGLGHERCSSSSGLAHEGQPSGPANLAAWLLRAAYLAAWLLRAANLAAWLLQAGQPAQGAVFSASVKPPPAKDPCQCW